MKRIGKFHKVSKERFVADWMDAFEGVSADEAEKIYEGIRLPRRATAGSAGYDFFAPFAFTLAPGETIRKNTIPTNTPAAPIALNTFGRDTNISPGPADIPSVPIKV